MNNLRNYLDERPQHFIPIYNSKKRGRKQLTNILYNLDQNYINFDTDPFIKRAAISSSSVPHTLIIKKENIIINKEIGIH